ncbi:MAG TPA: VWA domain-containing protein, partial [Blastocatellia bacterium]|nr:VWA domain-containing protein [Blastocatellia bacterium]
RIRVDGARIAVDATLRAAAPYQVARRARRKSASSRRESTLRKSLVEIVQDDLRFKCFKRRSGVLFIFAVDASGSMAVNRMAQAKGAIARLLGEAYLHRDKVALISFRGSNADILLAPTRSVELAKQLVDAMPTGGGTPIGAGLLKALGLARLARLQGIRRAVILLMTDGRGNVAARARGSGPIHPWDAVDELAEIGAVLAGERIESVVIDTRSSFVSSGEADRLAKRIGARYLYLPRRDIDTMNAAVADVAAQLRN